MAEIRILLAESNNFYIIEGRNAIAEIKIEQDDIVKVAEDIIKHEKIDSYYVSPAKIFMMAVERLTNIKFYRGNKYLGNDYNVHDSQFFREIHSRIIIILDEVRPIKQYCKTEVESSKKYYGARRKKVEDEYISYLRQKLFRRAKR